MLTRLDRIRGLIAAAVLACGVAPLLPAQVVPGVTVLVTDSLHLLRGKRVGLITNHTGRDARGMSSIDLLHRTPGVRLVALFGPEHGLRGLAQAGEHVRSSVDSATGVPIYSLYGDTRVPTDSMLRDVDVLVYDIQDVGARVYTYEWTMALAAEAAGRRGIPFVVCDRPVPITGRVTEGNILDPAFRSFVGQYPVALRYALTPGELLRHLVRTGQVRAQVHVAPMRGWRRTMWYDETGLPWVAPSPNLRTLDAALLYPGMVLFEGTNLSEGRGTDAPFLQVGAPWLYDAGVIARAFNAQGMPGLRADSVLRTVAAGQKFGGQTIPMVRLTVTDRAAVRSVPAGAWLVAAIAAAHPAEFRWVVSHFDRLAGTDALRLAIQRGPAAVAPVLAAWDRQAAQFAGNVVPDHLYP